MRWMTALIVATGATLAAAGGHAQTSLPNQPQTNSMRPIPPIPEAQPQTSGAASTTPAAPIGHRQPRASQIPDETRAPAVDPVDRQIDRSLRICKGC
jgi:hypothetical protein